MPSTLLWRTNDSKSSQTLYDHLNYLKDKSQGKQKEYVVTIKANKAIRSVSANARYWMILKSIAVESGHTEDELHEYYKKRFNGKEIAGETVGMTTTEMNEEEFSVYMKKVETHGKEFFGAYISQPQDRSYSVWEKITKEKYDAMYNAI